MKPIAFGSVQKGDATMTRLIPYALLALLSTATMVLAFLAPTVLV